MRLGHPIADRLKLEAEAGETLRKRVVHLVGEEFAFFQHCAKTPLLNPAEYEHDHEKKEQDPESCSHDVAGAPPWRARDGFNVVD